MEDDDMTNAHVITITGHPLEIATFYTRKMLLVTFGTFGGVVAMPFALPFASQENVTVLCICDLLLVVAACLAMFVARRDDRPIPPNKEYFETWRERTVDWCLIVFAVSTALSALVSLLVLADRFFLRPVTV